MSCCFGLYFGNTNMCLAMNKDGKTEVLANAAGDRVTPAIVAFLNGERSVGLAAKHGMYRNAENTIVHVKEFVGSDEIAMCNHISNSKCKIVEKSGYKYEIEKDGKLYHYSSHEILVTLFTTMKEIAGSHSHSEDVYPIVVTVPLNFTKEQRALIRKAVADAGFQLLRLISEPAAAALAYGIGQDSVDSRSNCLVFRMGGTSLDVTVLQVIDGMYNIASNVHRQNLGGKNLTNLVLDFCASEFQRMYKFDVRESKRSVMKLRNASEICKHVLSTLGSAQCFAESIYDGIDLSVNVSRARFESCLNSLLQQCLEPVYEALKIANLSVSDVNTVVLAGGSCKIPKLQQLFSSTFSSGNILFTISPDEVIAVGAATQATIVSQDDAISDEEHFLELVAQDLSIKVMICDENPEVFLLCPKGTLVPTMKRKKVTVPENCTKLSIEILEEINSSQEKMTTVAKLSIENVPAGEYSFSFHIKSDGSIKISCTDSLSKELGSVTVVSLCNEECT